MLRQACSESPLICILACFEQNAFEVENGIVGSTSHLVLIRHAHTEGNDFSNGSARLCGQCDLPLSEAGTRQVERLRARLAADPARALYSSPLERARKTAVAAAPHLAEGMRILKSLAEIDCGELDGMLLREVQARYPALWQRNLSQADEDFQWPGGESYRRLRRRALRVVRRIAERHKGERVLLVTHAGFISSLLGFLAGANPAEWSKFRPGNASVTEVLWNGHGGDLITFDDRSHLEPDGRWTASGRRPERLDGPVHSGIEESRPSGPAPLGHEPTPA